MNQNFIYSNYHVHSNFCDGHNSIRQMAEAAFKNNIKSLGFSSHAMKTFSTEWHLKAENYDSYFEEINKVKEEYKSKIEIFSGLEADFIKGYSMADLDEFKKYKPDYLIGAVHFVPSDRGTFEADASVKDFPGDIKRVCNGDVKKAVQSYFETERQMLKECNFTILAHPDLIRKQNSKEEVFDEKSEWYKKEIKLTVKEIKKSGVCVEINTGGIARGYLTDPYPSMYFLELLNKENIPVMINTDAHKTEDIAFWYDKAIQYALKAGYKELAFLKEGKVSFQKIY